jgi:prevent-host-death family protein
MKTVPLRGKKAAGRVALVDDENLPLVIQYAWHLHEDSRPDHRGTVYARTKTSPSKGLFMHTLITGWSRVDHADHDGLNNQKYNLRPASQGQNKANGSRYNCSPEFKGVYQKGSRWYAAIRVDKRLRHLGTFADPAEAARAYDAAALAAWGVFARLNFPAAVLGSPAVQDGGPMDARELRDRLGTRIDAAHLRHEPTVITQDGEPQAVLISYAEWLATAG